MYLLKIGPTEEGEDIVLNVANLRYVFTGKNCEKQKPYFVSFVMSEGDEIMMSFESETRRQQFLDLFIADANGMVRQ